jgi:cytochrome c biogenesis protein CcdA
MTQQEIENELLSLRGQEEARKKNWRSIRTSAAFGAAVFLLGGMGFLIFSAVYPDSRHEMLQTAIMFIMLSLPMSLLGAALR